MLEILATALDYPGLMWIPAAIVSVQFLLALWWTYLKQQGVHYTNFFGDPEDNKAAVIVISIIMWAVFLVAGAAWASTDFEKNSSIAIPGSAHWMEFGVECFMAAFFLVSSFTTLYAKRGLAALAGLSVFAKDKVLARLIEGRKAHQERWLVSTKNARSRARLFLSELEDAIPVEFTGARMLASQMATDAVEVLIVQRKRIIHDTESLTRDLKRYKRAVEGTPESCNFATIKRGIEEYQHRLRAVERKLHALILFLDEVETPIRLVVQEGASEAEVDQFLRSYCTKHKIAMSEPAPSDPKLIEAQAEVEGCSAAEREKVLIRIRAVAASKQNLPS